MATAHSTAQPTPTGALARISNGRAPRILIAGLGNLLMQDDGVGIHAIRALRQRPHPGVALAEVGTAVLDALHILERADKILAIDAMHAGGSPGTIYRCQARDLAAPGNHSLHEFSLLSAVPLMRKQPAEILFLCVEPAKIEFGMELTPPVAASMNELLDLALAACQNWLCAVPCNSAPSA